MTVEYARFPSPDTTLDAARVYYELIGRMTPEERLARMFEMERECESWSASGVRRRHPEYSEQQVGLVMARVRLGPELFRKVFPGVEVPPP